MSCPDPEPLLYQFAKLLQWAYHDGLYDFDKKPWEQNIAEFKETWEKITRPENLRTLERRIGTAEDADWNAIFDEAAQQAKRRATQF